MGGERTIVGVLLDDAFAPTAVVRLLPTHGELDPIRVGGALVQQLLAIVKPEKTDY